MKFSDIVKDIVSSTSDPITPQEIRDRVKMRHPDFYGISAHLRNVEKGHYNDIDHALLAQIYSVVGTSGTFLCWARILVSLFYPVGFQPVPD
jgi:hypothetical protein